MSTSSPPYLELHPPPAIVTAATSVRSGVNLPHIAHGSCHVAEGDRGVALGHLERIWGRAHPA